MARFCLIVAIYLLFGGFSFAQASLDHCRPPYSDFLLLKLKRELTEAQRQLVLQKEHVEQLEQAIAFQEIELIQKELNKINPEEVVKDRSYCDQLFAFFDHQREILGQIICKYPECREKAQELLDQILGLITSLGDSTLQ